MRATRTVVVPVVLTICACASVSTRPGTRIPGISSDTPVIEYSPVSLKERQGKRIELIEDLVITAREGDPDLHFSRPMDLVVDDKGRIYLHDSGNWRVQVFDADGTFLRTITSLAEHKPYQNGWISLSGGRLVTSTGRRLCVWSLDGEHLYDRSLMFRAFSRYVEGTTDGYLIGPFSIVDEDEQRFMRIDRIALDERESTTYGLAAAGRRRQVFGVPTGQAAFVATPTGEAYLTAGEEYEVLAIGASGEQRWVLRVPWPREALQPLDSGQAPEEVEGDELTPALSVRWTAGRAGIGRGYPLRRDGQGRIYVFPYVPRTWDRDDRPVDVYSPAGERLFAGMIPERSWLRSQGDFIYGIDVDAATDQARVVRYRLLAPF